MTRTSCSRSSKRKPSSTLNLECKENVPLMPRVTKRLATKNKSVSSATEKESPNSNVSSRNKSKIPKVSANKSITKTKLSKDSNKHVDIKTNRHVLFDKTNTQSLPDDSESLLDENSEIRLLKTVENKSKVVQKLISVPKTVKDATSASYVPVYRAVGGVEDRKQNSNHPIEKSEAIYEFEVDENEEPVNSKKRKKRVYTKKPKLGPKALTINNIKYSSTESLVSLPEKPIARKKKSTKRTNLKPTPSVTSLTSTEDSNSVQSFMSHPPSLVCSEKRNHNSKHELSVLFESQSEQNTSHLASQPEQYTSHLASHSEQNSSHLSPENQEDSLPQPLSTTTHSTFSGVPGPSSRHNISKSRTPKTSFLPEASLYAPSFIAQASSCAADDSSASQNFLSSTPCKRTSAVVCNNSVFDDSYDSPNSTRHSRGFIKNLSVDNCFGFDEPEELEEPLVSPIKNPLHRKTICAVKKLPKELLKNEPHEQKPSVQEVIDLLKASIPKDTRKQKLTDIFDIEPENQDNSLPLSTNEEIVEVSFKKPPRRSYERQRPIRQKNDTEDEEEIEKEDIKETSSREVEENIPKKGNKCYKRINISKSAKTKVTKAQQKMAKEEEEMERLAAKMNAQFQQIEKVSLIVE